MACAGRAGAAPASTTPGGVDADAERDPLRRRRRERDQRDGTPARRAAATPRLQRPAGRAAERGPRVTSVSGGNARRASSAAGAPASGPVGGSSALRACGHARGSRSVAPQSASDSPGRPTSRETPTCQPRRAERRRRAGEGRVPALHDQAADAEPEAGADVDAARVDGEDRRPAAPAGSSRRAARRRAGVALASPMPDADARRRRAGRSCARRPGRAGHAGSRRREPERDQRGSAQTSARRPSGIRSMARRRRRTRCRRGSRSGRRGSCRSALMRSARMEDLAVEEVEDVDQHQQRRARSGHRPPRRGRGRGHEAPACHDRQGRKRRALTTEATEGTGKDEAPRPLLPLQRGPC